MKYFTQLLTPLLLLSSIGITNAAILSLTPSSQIAGTGDIISLDLEISGLGNHAASSLGDFDLDISFDDSKLNFLSGTFGTDLGIPDPFFDDIFESGIGTITAFQLSFVDPGDLIANQSEAFVLATFDFFVDSLALGDSTVVDFGTIYSLGDENGIALNIDSTNSALIRNPGNNVPEPATWILMLSGFMFALRKGKMG